MKKLILILALALVATACGPFGTIQADLHNRSTSCPTNGHQFVLDTCTLPSDVLYAARPSFAPTNRARVVAITTVMDNGVLNIQRWVVPAGAKPSTYSSFVSVNPNGSGPDCGASCDYHTGIIEPN